MCYGSVAKARPAITLYDMVCDGFPGGSVIKVLFPLLSLGLLALASHDVLLAAPPPIPISPPVSVAQPSPEFTTYTLKPGTPFQIILQTPLSTAVNQVDDPVEAAVSQNFYLGRDLLLSRQDRMRGRINRLEPPIEGRNAILSVTFTELVLNNGERLPIRAHIRTELADHSWGGGLTEGTKPMSVVHRVTGIGEYNKTVYGGPRRMGEHVEILPGERWTVILEQPVTLVVSNSQD